MIKKLIGICLLVLLLTNLAFLPGPNILYYPAQAFYVFGEIIGIFGLLLIPIGIIWTVLEFRRKETKDQIRLLSILCWLAPLTAFLSTTYLSNEIRNWSRSIAIQHAEKIIRQIEVQKEGMGKYPDNIESLNIDLNKTGIIGIHSYHYEKKNEVFELSFAQNVILYFNFEIVTYNPIDSHKAEGELPELYDTNFPHWKYYIFD